VSAAEAARQVQEISMQSRYVAFFAALVAMVSMTALFASAAPFSNVFVYGDSLSDLGNIYLVSGHTIPPSPPYYMGRFSNGPLTVEYLANSLHSPLTSFAWGGATTGIGDSGDGGTQTSRGTLGLPGMLLQVQGSLSSVAPSAPTSLFIVWGGPDDFITGGSVAVGVTDILTIVGALQSVGATHILVPGMPDMGLTPAYNGDQAATAFSFAFDQALQASLPHGVTYFDTFGFMHLVVSNPGAFGFTDVADACLVGLTPCTNPNQYLFWDDLHPTTAADRLLAAQFASAVPEPSTLLMLGTGVVGLAGVRRRRFLQ
jgi:phospholipase/lecithinase/hemolysin